MDSREAAEALAQAALNVARAKAGMRQSPWALWRVGEDLLEDSHAVPEELKTQAKEALYGLLFPEYSLDG